MKRRQILLGSLALAAFAATLGRAGTGRARAASPEVFPDDRMLGSAEAPLTIIEYSSLTCPHCAALHMDALPRIKETWIADGRARLIFRHFPLDGLALRAAAVANCIEGDAYFGFLDLLYKNQQRWAHAEDPTVALGQMTRLAGLSQSQFESCIGNEAEMDKILVGAETARKDLGVQSTPTLFVNGRKIEGARSFEDLDALFIKIMAES